MGWSCSRKAGLTLEAIQNFCFNQNRLNNIFETPFGRYMFEVGKERSDGAICAVVWKYRDGNHVTRAGGFRIEPSGEMSRGPAILKNLTVLIVKFNNMEELWTGGEVTKENLDKYVSDWQRSFQSGGVNEHIGMSQETRFPKVAVCKRNGEVLLEWESPMFVVD